MRGENYLQIMPDQYIYIYIYIYWHLWCPCWTQLRYCVYCACCYCVLSQIARFMGPTWAYLGPTGPRWAPSWPQGLCYLGCIKKLKPIHNDWRFADDRLKSICLGENCCVYIQLLRIFSSVIELTQFILANIGWIIFLRQAGDKTNYDLVYRRTVASLGLNELKFKFV